MLGVFLEVFIYTTYIRLQVHVLLQTKQNNNNKKRTSN